MRVMTYNILTDGRDLFSDDKSTHRRALIAEVIAAHQPDVVMLHEVSTEAFMQELAEQVGMEWRIGNRVGAWNIGVALLSRRSILSAEPIPVGVGRDALSLTVEADDGEPLTVYGIHTHAFYSWMAERTRHRQIKGLLAAATQPRHLLVGDFNTFAPGDKVDLSTAPRWVKMQTWPQLGFVARWALKQIYRAGYIDCFRYFHPDEHGFTLPSRKPNVRLDYIFATSSLENHLKDCFVVETPDIVRDASDHLPVIVDFQF